jgi:hypothetical protein
MKKRRLVTDNTLRTVLWRRRLLAAVTSRRRSTCGPAAKVFAMPQQQQNKFIYCIRCKKLNLLQKIRRIMRESPCRDLKSSSPAKRHLFIFEENMSESGGKMSLPKRTKRTSSCVEML